MKRLSALYPEIRSRLRGKKVLLFLDYDGTLVPIRPSPELARLSSGPKKLLARLVRLPGFHAGLLTGRSLKDIRRAVRVSGLFYAANYGLAVFTPQKRWVHPEARRKSLLLKKMLPQLRKLCAEFRGVRVEDKTLTAAIHHRQYRGRPGLLRKKLEAVVRASPGRFQLKTGKKIFEVYPAVQWDKGKALLKVEKLLGCRRAPLVVFFGDDRADEEAFRRMRPADISVAVGKRNRTAARFFCKNSGEVARFLRVLLAVGSDERS